MRKWTINAIVGGIARHAGDILTEADERDTSVINYLNENPDAVEKAKKYKKSEVKADE